MAIYALKSGNTPAYNISNAISEQQANYDTSVNPIIKNQNTKPSSGSYPDGSIVCYEIWKEGGVPSSAATNGVGYSNSSLNFFNRKYPDTTTVADYLENLDRTEGHRIQCYRQELGGAPQQLATDLLDDNDYFVMVFADDYTKHHFYPFFKYFSK